MGYTKESRNFAKLIASANPTSITDPLSPDRGLASDLFMNMVNNGFKLIYHNGGGDTTNPAELWKATEVVFEPKNKVEFATGYVDPIGDVQPWRVGFVVQGNDNGIPGNGNELIAYLGTPSTLTTAGINRAYAYPVILLEGGDRVTDTRITATREHGYRISITDRGVAILVWNPMKIEDMRHMGLLCIQRPVKCDGTTLVDGFAPVFAVHNTDPMSAGRARQSERFFRTTLRERDTNIPPKSSASIVTSKRRATGTINIRKLTGTNGNIRHTFKINGVDVWFGTGQSAPTNQRNDLAFFPDQSGTQNDPLYNAAEAFARQLNNSTQGPLQEMTYTAAGPNVIITAKKEGTDGNKIKFEYTGGDPNNIVVSPSNGYLGGGGGKPVADRGTIKVNTNPPAGASITIGTGAGLKIDFVATTPTVGQPQVQVGATLADTVTNLMNALLKLQFSQAPLQGVTFSLDAKTATILVDNDTLVTPSNFKMTSADAAITVSATLTGGNTNVATGFVNFAGIPNENAILQINGVDFAFVYGQANGESEVSLGTRTVPLMIDQVVKNLVYKLTMHSSEKIQMGRYEIETNPAKLPAGVLQRLNIEYAGPGVEGNTFTLYTDNSNIGFSHVGSNTITSLTGGAGFAATLDTAMYPDEISELTGKLGSTMYRFPNKWEGPVQTDTGEYVLVFPFGFSTEKVSFTEELDMIAVSKGAAYQGVQSVNLNVYGSARTYTSYCSNFETQSDYVRVFILTNGGGI